MFVKSQNKNLVEKCEKWIKTHLEGLNKNFYGEGLLELIDILSIFTENSDLKENLSQSSLEWSIGVYETNLSYNSLRLFKLLNTKWSSKLTQMFLSSIYISLQTPFMNLPSLNTTQLYITILNDRVKNKNVNFTKEDLQSMLDVSFHMLLTSSVSQYKEALSLVQQIKTRNESVSLSSFFTVWNQNSQIFSILTHGSFNKETSSLLMWFLKELAKEKINNENYSFTLQILLVLVTNFTLHSDKDKNSALEFFSSGASSFDFSPYKTIFTRPNLRIKEISMRQFLKDVFFTFASQFPLYSQYLQVLDFLLLTIRNGNPSDQKFYWFILEEFLK